MAVSKGISVLLVDDEPDILELIKDEFDYSGFNTITAASGNEAIEVLKNNKIDAVVSDYKMPNGTGMDLLKFVNTLASRPVFYFVSGQADISIDEALKLGAKKFFAKPFDIDELIKEVESSFVK